MIIHHHDYMKHYNLHAHVYLSGLLDSPIWHIV